MASTTNIATIAMTSANKFIPETYVGAVDTPLKLPSEKRSIARKEIGRCPNAALNVGNANERATTLPMMNRFPFSTQSRVCSVNLQEGCK